MLMMRLQRIGRRNQPHFRIVVIEKSRGPKSQKYIDIVGSYNPKQGEITLDAEKAKSWIEKGVQPSDTVFNFLLDKDVVEGRKINVLPKKTPTKKRNAPDEPEATEEEAPAEAPAEASEEAKTADDTEAKEEAKEEVASSEE